MELTNSKTQIEILEAELLVKEELLTKLQNINNDLNCTTVKLQTFLNEAVNEFIDPITGKWITIKWYNVSKILKALKMFFVFVKSTLKDCYNVEFSPRVNSVFEIIIN
jgi:hypothetical protein